MYGNALEGEIPQKLYNMTYLQILDLHGNQLDGSIPQDLRNLSRLQYLDLSHNSLSRIILYSLRNLSKLTYFNLSNNDVSGTIPTTVQDYGRYAFINKHYLCGAPLEDQPCSLDGNGTVTSTSKKPKALWLSAIIAIVVAAMILIGICLVFVINILARRKKMDDGTMVIESTPLGLT